MHSTVSRSLSKETEQNQHDAGKPIQKNWTSTARMTGTVGAGISTSPRLQGLLRTALHAAKPTQRLFPRGACKSPPPSQRTPAPNDGLFMVRYKTQMRPGRGFEGRSRVPQHLRLRSFQRRTDHFEPYIMWMELRSHFFCLGHFADPIFEPSTICEWCFPRNCAARNSSSGPPAAPS